MKGVTIPREIIDAILSFIKINSEVLYSLGSTCSIFYLAILQNWKTITVTKSNVFMISLLSLRNAKTIIIENRGEKIIDCIDEKSLEYLWCHVSPNKLKTLKIFLSTNTGINRVFKSLNKYVRNRINNNNNNNNKFDNNSSPFVSLRTLEFLEHVEHTVISNTSGSLIQKRHPWWWYRGDDDKSNNEEVDEKLDLDEVMDNNKGMKSIFPNLKELVFPIELRGWFEGEISRNLESFHTNLFLDGNINNNYTDQMTNLYKYSNGGSRVIYHCPYVINKFFNNNNNDSSTNSQLKYLQISSIIINILQSNKNPNQKFEIRKFMKKLSQRFPNLESLDIESTSFFPHDVTTMGEENNYISLCENIHYLKKLKSLSIFIPTCHINEIIFPPADKIVSQMKVLEAIEFRNIQLITSPDFSIAANDTSSMFNIRDMLNLPFHTTLKVISCSYHCRKHSSRLMKIVQSIIDSLLQKCGSTSSINKMKILEFRFYIPKGFYTFTYKNRGNECGILTIESIGVPLFREFKDENQLFQNYSQDFPKRINEYIFNHKIFREDLVMKKKNTEKKNENNNNNNNNVNVFKIVLEKYYQGKMFRKEHSKIFPAKVFHKEFQKISKSKHEVKYECREVLVFRFTRRNELDRSRFNVVKNNVIIID